MLEGHAKDNNYALCRSMLSGHIACLKGMPRTITMVSVTLTDTIAAQKFTFN